MFGIDLMEEVTKIKDKFGCNGEIFLDCENYRGIKHALKDKDDVLWLFIIDATDLVTVCVPSNVIEKLHDFIKEDE